MHIEFKDLLESFCWTNKVTIQMSLDFILHPTTNLHSCSIRTLVNVLAQILDSSQSSRDLYIDITRKSGSGKEFGYRNVGRQKDETKVSRTYGSGEKITRWCLYLS